MLKTILSTAALSTAALSMALATPAFAIDAMKSADVSAPPDKVWATIGDFCGIGQWHPAVEKCEPMEKGGKQMRKLSLKGGGSITEEQKARDDKKMDYTYIILESPLPVSNYKSTIMVEPAGQGSKVSWKGNFMAKGAPDAKAKEVIEGIYDAGLKGIADKAK